MKAANWFTGKDAMEIILLRAEGWQIEMINVEYRNRVRIGMQ